jgi:CrcB protein
LALAVGFAGALGAVARYGLAEWVALRWRQVFPLATFIINISGAFALGLLYTVGTAHILIASTPVAHGTAVSATWKMWRIVLGTGFLGGYTTFSTLSFETTALARRGRTAAAWLNALGTLAASLLAVAAGIALGNAL